MLYRKILAASVASVALFSLSPNTASAKELRIASSSPPTYELYNPVFTTFMEQLSARTNGELTAKHFGLEVVSLRNAVSSLENGVIDIGNFLPSYTPADFPNSALISDLSPLGHMGSAMMAATVEYLATCADCQTEFKNKGFVYTASVSTPPYQLITASKPVATPEDIKGLRLRSAGTAFSLWIKTMGAIPTEISFNEEYEALQGGLVDGTVAPPANLVGNRLGEVTKYFTPIPVATFNVTSSFTVRQQVWKDLPEEQRRAIVDAAIDGVAKNDFAMRQTGDKALETFKSQGGTVVEPTEALIEANKAVRDAAIAMAIENGKNLYKVENAEEKVNHFVELIDKWTAIMEPIQDDPAAIAEAVRTGVWDKIDVNTYGM